jgi:hypothetical protein
LLEFIKKLLKVSKLYKEIILNNTETISIIEKVYATIFVLMLFLNNA